MDIIKKLIFKKLMTKTITKTITKKPISCFISAMLVCLVGASQASYAESLNLATTTPLAISVPQGVQSNILLALDDSASMKTTHINQPKKFDYMFEGWYYKIRDHLSSQTDTIEERLLEKKIVDWDDLQIAVDMSSTRSDPILFRRCVGFNPLAYDPNVIYAPWAGYTNASITAAPKNDPEDTTTRIDLTETKTGYYGHGYIPWDDKDGDGKFSHDQDVQLDHGTGECAHGRKELAAYPQEYWPVTVDDSKYVEFNDMTAEQKQNYANWFSYHRKPLHAMKHTVSHVIANSNARMGLATMNDNAADVGTPVSNMAVKANKDALLAALFKITAEASTPTRNFMNTVGQYFDQAGNNSDHDTLGFSDASPINSQAEGGECQKNFAVLFTDGAYNGTYLDEWNDYDGDNSSDYDGGPHAGLHTSTLADIAMRYYETDLSTTLDNEVTTSTYTDPSTNITYTDDNPQQHLNTYIVTFGVGGAEITLPIDHLKTTSPPAGGWPLPSLASDIRIDMQHAAFNGRGLSFFSSTPQQLTEAFEATFTSIEQRGNLSSTAVAINSGNLNVRSHAYTALYSSADWTGKLSAYAFDENSDVIDTAVWEASEQLPVHTNRKIFTMTNDTSTGVEFKPNADTTADTSTVETAIGTLNVGGTDYTAADIINYIRGDKSLETSPGLRVRTSLLGDIINASPISQSTENFANGYLSGTEGSSYSNFVATKYATFGNKNVIYVGSNDGMLHAFEDDSISASANGEELFAYVPSSVHGKLKHLADPNYNHRFYVNGGISIADVYINDAWKTILVATLGEGGRTIFALDISNPFSFEANDVLWEYSYDDDALANRTNADELGFVLHKPQIARLNNGQWGVIFGNGYNSQSGQSKTFILNAATGNEIAVLDSEFGDTATVEELNGMAMPFLADDDSNITVDTLYAGDLQGNLWKFDISSDDKTAWQSAFSTGGSPAPLFVAYDGDSTTAKRQPITTRPTVAVNKKNENMILFGTGKFIEINDANAPTYPDTYQLQTFYGIIDKGAQVDSRNTTNDLQQQTITYQDTGSGVRTVSKETVTGAETGWYLDLRNPNLETGVNGGERVIANSMLNKGKIIIPTFSNTVIGDSCLITKITSGYITVVSALNGASSEKAVFDTNDDGIVESQDLIDTDGDGIGDSVAAGIGAGIGAGQATLVDSDNDSNSRLLSICGDTLCSELINTGATADNLSGGRQSWHQVE